MDSIIAILQYPLTAIGVAGFIALQAYQFVRWSERQADLSGWRVWVEEAATVYLRATGKSLAALEAQDVSQIAAAAGCSAPVAATCLDDLRRRAQRP